MTPITGVDLSTGTAWTFYYVLDHDDDFGTWQFRVFDKNQVDFTVEPVGLVLTLKDCPEGIRLDTIWAYNEKFQGNGLPKALIVEAERALPRGKRIFFDPALAKAEGFVSTEGDCFFKKLLRAGIVEKEPGTNVYRLVRTNP